MENMKNQNEKGGAYEKVDFKREERNGNIT